MKLYQFVTAGRRKYRNVFEDSGEMENYTIPVVKIILIYV
jgi:hypothetical protein